MIEMTFEMHARWNNRRILEPNACAFDNLTHVHDTRKMCVCHVGVCGSANGPRVARHCGSSHVKGTRKRSSKAGTRHGVPDVKMTVL